MITVRVERIKVQPGEMGILHQFSTMFFLLHVNENLFSTKRSMSQYSFTCCGSLRAMVAKHDRQVAIKSCGGLGDGVHLKQQGLPNCN